jgi:hypothetical protein
MHGGADWVDSVPLPELISTKHLEDYERAIGRKAHPEDFADIDEIMGQDRFEKMDYPTDAVNIVPVKKPDQHWWKDVLEKTGGKEKETK